MTPEQLKERTTDYAAAVVRFSQILMRRPGSFGIPPQLADAAGSVASNYRCACRARSRREFVSKLGVALEEAEEVVGWLVLTTRSGLATIEETAELQREGQELLAILASSFRTAERNLKDGGDSPRRRR